MMVIEHNSTTDQKLAALYRIVDKREAVRLTYHSDEQGFGLDIRGQLQAFDGCNLFILFPLAAGEDYSADDNHWIEFLGSAVQSIWLADELSGGTTRIRLS